MLGLTLSAALKFDDHVWLGNSTLCKSIHKKMSVLANVKPHVNQETLAKIGECLISSTILYGAPVWAQTSSKNLDALQVAQTKAARLVTRKKGWTNPRLKEHRQQMFTSIGWKNVRQLVTMSNLNLVKKATEKQSAHSINSLFTSNIPAHPRGPACLRVDYIGKSSRGKLNFEVEGAKIFNAMPANMKSPLLNLKSFKGLVKQYVLTLHHLPSHFNHDY